MRMDRIRLGDVMIGVAIFAAIFQIYRASPWGEPGAALLASLASLAFILIRLVRTD